MDLNGEREDKVIDPTDMTVLIVDDMDAMCKSIRGLLKVLSYGKQFYFAHDGVAVSYTHLTLPTTPYV